MEIINALRRAYLVWPYPPMTQELRDALFRLGQMPPHKVMPRA